MAKKKKNLTKMERLTRIVSWLMILLMLAGVVLAATVSIYSYLGK